MTATGSAATATGVQRGDVSVTDASNRIVQKLWSYCNVLRDDGLSYQDYLKPRAVRHRPIE